MQIRKRFPCISTSMLAACAKHVAFWPPDSGKMVSSRDYPLSCNGDAFAFGDG